MEGLAHVYSHSHMAREATGIDGDLSSQTETLAEVVPGGYPKNTPIFHNCLFDRMTQTQFGPCRNCPARKVLIEPTHVHNTGHRRIVVQQHFTMWGDKIDSSYRVVELFGNSQSLYIADPTTTTGMDRIAD